MNWFKKATLHVVASKEILYHGTSLNNLREILKVGLIPNPKKRVWETDQDESSSRLSRESYGGIYLTNNFMTAKSAATTAGDPKSGMIVAVRVETKTLIADEDNLIYKLQYGLNAVNEGYLMNEFMMIGTFIEYKLGKMEDKFRKAANHLLDLILENIPEPTKQKTKENSIEVFTKMVKALLIRNLAFTLKEYSEPKRNGWETSQLKHRLEEFGLSIDDIPDVQTAWMTLKNLIDQGTRKIAVISKQVNESNYTSRSMTPIAYGGANKIVCVMEYETKHSVDEPSDLIFHYCSDIDAAKHLIQEWINHIGSKTKVTGIPS